MKVLRYSSAAAVVGAVMGLYAAVFELVMGSTPGKRIAKCYVVGEGGGPAGAWPIFVRNVLRILEFHFLAVVLLVFLTPGRQRLGDMLARTTVVEPVPTGA